MHSAKNCSELGRGTGTWDNAASWHLDFRLMRHWAENPTSSFQTSDLQNCKITNEFYPGQKKPVIQAGGLEGLKALPYHWFPKRIWSFPNGPARTLYLELDTKATVPLSLVTWLWEISFFVPKLGLKEGPGPDSSICGDQGGPGSSGGEGETCSARFVLPDSPLTQRPP